LLLGVHSEIKATVTTTHSGLQRRNSIVVQWLATYMLGDRTNVGRNHGEATISHSLRTGKSTLSYTQAYYTNKTQVGRT